MIPAPPYGAWTVVARNPTFGGPSVMESDVLDFQAVWLNAAGDELRVDPVTVPESDAMPMPKLNAALRTYSRWLRTR